MADKKYKAGEVSYEIVKALGTLREAEGRRWAREVNLISWNEKAPKIDIRDWSPDHERMGKGLTLTAEEFEKLQAIDYQQEKRFDYNVPLPEEEIPSYEESYEM